jgi:hypothetical protein
MIIKAKWCPSCEALRPVERFTPDASKADGLQSRCRECDNAKCREYYRARGGRETARRRYQRRKAERSTS